MPIAQASQGAIEHPMQKRIDLGSRQVAQRERLAQLQSSPQQPASTKGLPAGLRAGVEALSGMDMSNVTVHRNSAKPAQLDAKAYAQGNEIHLGPGQETHLPHEAWHVVQQREGRVAATSQLAGAPINDQQTLEREADVMGARALQLKRSDATQGTSLPGRPLAVAQRGGDDVAQFKGPRKYAENFKDQKDQFVNWLKASGIVGFDLTPEAEASDEENQKIGWHHMYPYSHLWEDHGHHQLADHAANLKLGPMKNRLGDPGHEIDVSYNKATKNEGGAGGRSIKPAYTKLGARLLKELSERPIPGSTERAPTNNIDIRQVDISGLEEQAITETTNKEDYWSEWYLSENLRKLKLSVDKVSKAITDLKIPAITLAKTSIIAKLNSKLDSLRYTYVTHTPSLPNGEVKAFDHTPTEETGIPSSKLNRNGELGERLVSSATPTYADLVHTLLVNEKWVIRGSQGSAHSLAEQFKDKMRQGNLALIQRLLDAATLTQLTAAVEAEFKKEVEERLSKYDNIAPKLTVIYTDLKAKQREKGVAALSKEEIAGVLIAKVGATLTRTQTRQEEVAPHDTAESFAIKYPQDHSKTLAAIFEKYTRNGHEEDELDAIARQIIVENGKKRWEYDDSDDSKGWVYTFGGKVVLSVDHLKSCIEAEVLKWQKKPPTAAPKSKPRGKSGAAKQPQAETVSERHLGDFAKELFNKLEGLVDEFEEYKQEPDFEDKEDISTSTAAEVAATMEKPLSKAGRNYMRHISALATPRKYAPSVEVALQQPGQGYASAELKYPLPKAVAEATSASWTYSEEEERAFREEWYTKEFSAFLTAFLASKALQDFLAERPPP